jgi:hypothetical protein
MDSMKVAKDFHKRFSFEFIEEMAQMQNLVLQKKKRLSKEKIEAKFEGWIPHTSFSYIWYRKIFRLIEIYWLNKAFIAQFQSHEGSWHDDAFHLMQ